MKDPAKANDPALEFYKTLSSQKDVDSRDIGLLMTELFSAGIDAVRAITFVQFKLLPTVNSFYREKFCNIFLEQVNKCNSMCEERGNFGFELIVGL